MTTTVDISEIKLLVDNVTDVVVTEAEQDTDSKWVREIRVFGEPAIEGGTKPVVATIRIKSETKENVNLTAPSVDF